MLKITNNQGDRDQTNENSSWCLLLAYKKASCIEKKLVSVNEHVKMAEPLTHTDKIEICKKCEDTYFFNHL